MKKWVDCSEEEDDKWFEEKQTETITQAAKDAKGDQGELALNRQSKESRGEKDLKNEVNKSESKKESQKGQYKYLSDEELITQIQNKTIESNRTIKAVRCLTQQAKEVLNRIPNLKSKTQYGEGKFILNFHKEEDLIAFIKAKIQNEYNFYLHPFLGGRENNDRRNGEKKKYVLRQDFENKARTDKNTGFKYDSKQHEKEVKEIKDFREMPAEPSHQSEEKSYCIMDQNKMIILRKEFSIDQILNGIKRNNLSQQFKLFRLFCPADCLEKTYKLCEEIYREFKYALSSEPSMDKMSDSFELVLIDNYPNKVLKECIDRLPKRLENSKDLYFKDLQETNINLLCKKFLPDDYLHLLKKEYKQVFGNWKKWIIRAESEHIEQLLRLCHAIRMDLPFLQVKIKIGWEEKPIAWLKITYEQAKDYGKAIRGRDKQNGKERPKVDTSPVNNYLNH